MRVTGLTPQDLKAYGIHDVQEIVYNPDYDTLYQEELNPALEGYERGVLTNLGAIAVDTGIFTGRSPKDKYIVRDDTTRDTFWWADKGKGKNDNKPLSPETWQHLKGLVTKQLSGKRLFVVDAFCGANPDTRLSVRFITEVAWQAHFVKNMFIRPSDEELAGFKPDFIVMNGAKCTNPQWKEQGLNSENFVAFNLTERIQLIGGTWYGGEMKKGMFSVMNYLLPLKGMASMHCSANTNAKGETAIFFLVPALFLQFYCGNWPNRFSTPINVLVRSLLVTLGGIAIYCLYYKYAHFVLGTQKGFSHPQQFPMIPMIWLINIWLINWWFMDGWPGWRREFKTAEDFAAEERHLAANAAWNPAMLPGVIIGLVVGVIAYFAIVALLPLASATFTLVQ